MIKKSFVFLISLMIGVCLLSVRVVAYDTAAVGENHTISMGLAHTAVIKEDNSLWVWGRNCEGQIGNGGKTDSKMGNDVVYQKKPVKVLDDVVSVSCGDYHTAALDMDGSLWVWGSNEYGQIGNGGKGDKTLSEYNKKYPIQTKPVKIMSDVVAVACGEKSTAAIKKDGSLWVWGSEVSGKPLTPKKFLDNVKAFSGEEYAGVVIMNDNSLFYWGMIEKKEYDGTYSGEAYNISKRFKLADNVSTMCYDGYLIFVKNDGTVWAWGSNGNGQYGNGKISENNFITKDLKPVKITGLKNIVSISSSCGTVAAIQSNGDLWMWGSNFFGQIGNGHNGKDYGSYLGIIQTKPEKILKDVDEINNGSQAVIALKKDGTLWAWGSNPNEQLGFQGGDSRLTISSPSSSATGWCVFYPRQVEVITIKDEKNISQDKNWKSTVKTTAGKDYVTISWDKAANASGYVVYTRKNGKYVKLLETTQTSITRKKLKSGSTYKFLVRYKLKDGSYSSMDNSCRVSITTKSS